MTMYHTIEGKPSYKDVEKIYIKLTDDFAYMMIRIDRIFLFYGVIKDFDFTTNYVKATGYIDPQLIFLFFFDVSR